MAGRPKTRAKREAAQERPLEELDELMGAEPDGSSPNGKVPKVRQYPNRTPLEDRYSPAGILGENTDLMPRVVFLGKVLVYPRVTLPLPRLRARPWPMIARGKLLDVPWLPGVMLLVAFIAYKISLGLVKGLPIDLQPVVIYFSMLLPCLLILRIAATKTVRLVYVIRSHRGSPGFLDEQHWWTKDEREWGDDWRQEFPSGKVLFVDALTPAAAALVTAPAPAVNGTTNGAGPAAPADASTADQALDAAPDVEQPAPTLIGSYYPFRPDLAPLPYVALASDGSLREAETTTGHLAGIDAEAASIQKVLSSFKSGREQIKQMLLVIIIVGAFVAMYLGGAKLTKPDPEAGPPPVRPSQFQSDR